MDLFSQPTGQELRDEGMAKAVETASKRLGSDWMDKSYPVLLKWLELPKTGFKCEDFRVWYISNGNPPPVNDRAFGALFMRAAREKRIFKIGYTQVNNPKAHRANCALWETI